MSGNVDQLTGYQSLSTSISGYKGIKNVICTGEDFSGRINLTGEPDTGTKKKEVLNNHHFTSTVFFSWFIVFMIVS